MKKLLILTLALVILFASCGKPPVYLPEASPGGAVKDNWTYETPEAGPYEGAFKNLSSQLYMEDGALYFDGGLANDALKCYYDACVGGFSLSATISPRYAISSSASP